MNESDQYEKVCKDRFDMICDKLDEQNESLSGLCSRLFEDNGRKSLQTKINENALWCQVIKWFTITMAGGVLLGFVMLLFDFISNAINK